MSRIVVLFWVACSWSIFCFASVSLPPQIVLKPDSDVVVEGKPITINMSVIHSHSQPVLDSSIRLDGEAISVQKIAEELVNPNNLYKNNLDEALIVSRFKVSLPGKTAGIYTIGPIYISFGPYTFASNTLTVNVQSPVIDRIFRLEARLLQADTVIYCGQTVTFEYRLYYTGSMKVTREDLPLLHPSGFITIGSPEVRDLNEGDGAHVQIILQQARADVPGKYELGASTVEGMKQIVRENGVSENLFPLYKAIAPSISLVISPLPLKNRPASFHGAIGSYVWRTRVLSQGRVNLGDTVEIEYRVSGRGDLSTVELPSKSTIFGLEEECVVDLWPKSGLVEGNTKTFTVKVRPKKPGECTVPSFEVSSFDPTSGQYLTAQVPFALIEVRGASGEGVSERTGEGMEPIIQENIGPIAVDPNAPAEIRWGPGTTISIMMSAIILSYIQARLKRFLGWNLGQNSKQIRAEKLFQDGFILKKNPKRALDCFRKAIFLRLFEVGLISTHAEAIGEISEGSPIVLESKLLISRIDHARYHQTDLTREEWDAVLDEVVRLYQKLKRLPEKIRERNDVAPIS